MSTLNCNIYLVCSVLNVIGYTFLSITVVSTIVLTIVKRYMKKDELYNE